MPRSFLVKKFVKKEDSGYHSYRVRDPYHLDVLDISLKAATPYTPYYGAATPCTPCYTDDTPYTPSEGPVVLTPLTACVTSGYIHDDLPCPTSQNGGDAENDQVEANTPHLESGSAATCTSLQYHQNHLHQQQQQEETPTFHHHHQQQQEPQEHDSQQETHQQREQSDKQPTSLQVVVETDDRMEEGDYNDEQEGEEEEENTDKWRQIVSGGADKTNDYRPSPSETKDDEKNEGDTQLNKAVTVGYTYHAFFITDGRSKRRQTCQEAAARTSDQEDIRSLDGSCSNSSSSSSSGSSDHGGVEVQFRAHVDSARRPRYRCCECGKDYATSSNLSRHKQTHRSLDGHNARKCPHCDKPYVSMPALAMHILTHDLRHVCQMCGKNFSRPWLLQGHMRSHTGEKPYGCAHCGKAFADRSNLRAHMQTHSALKHFTCDRCNKSFALKSYLNKHHESSCVKQ